MFPDGSRVLTGGNRGAIHVRSDDGRVIAELPPL